MRDHLFALAATGYLRAASCHANAAACARAGQRVRAALYRVAESLNALGAELTLHALGAPVPTPPPTPPTPTPPPPASSVPAPTAPPRRNDRPN